MLPPVIPFVKAAVVIGTVAGVGDCVLQWARGLKHSRVKRKGRIDSWDATRTTQVAIVAAAVGPLLIVPSVRTLPGVDDLAVLAGAALVEAGMLPFFYCWQEDLLFSFKSNIPRLVVIGPTYTMGLTFVAAHTMDHLPSITTLGQLGTLMPEGIVWTAGLGLTSFFLFAFVHQTALCTETKMSKDRDPLVRRAKLVGALCSASLLGVVALDIQDHPLAHLFLTDMFWMSGMVYQCFLTYIQSLEVERCKAHGKAGKGDMDGADVAAHLRLRTLLNVAMVGGTLAYRPFETSGQEAVALGLKGFVSMCWLAYFLTFDKEYEFLDGDAVDWALVSTDDEERARRKRQQTRKERTAQRQEAKEKRKQDREAKLLEAEKASDSWCSVTSDTDTASSHTEKDEKGGDRRREQKKVSKHKAGPEPKGRHDHHREGMARGERQVPRQRKGSPSSSEPDGHSGRRGRRREAKDAGSSGDVKAGIEAAAGVATAMPIARQEEDRQAVVEADAFTAFPSPLPTAATNPFHTQSPRCTPPAAIAVGWGDDGYHSAPWLCRPPDPLSDEERGLPDPPEQAARSPSSPSRPSHNFPNRGSDD